MRKYFLISLFFAPIILFAQSKGLPEERFVLWKVWSSDSSALKNLGYGDYVFSDQDTVVLQGSDTDTLTFNTAQARGYFNVWVIADTANFPVGGESHNHTLGATDSLTLAYRPKLEPNQRTGNPASSLNYLHNLDWNAEDAYYESITPPLAEYLEFYISHFGEGDTSAVIIQVIWQ
jgi:hypothetical protein